MNLSENRWFEPNNRAEEILLSGKGGLVLLGIFVGTVMFFWIKNSNEVKNFEFNGHIEQVSYDAKNIPEIKVNSKKYVLTGGWGFKRALKAGDEVIKKKGELIIKVVHRNKRDTLFFTL